MLSLRALWLACFIACVFPGIVSGQAAGPNATANPAAGAPTGPLIIQLRRQAPESVRAVEITLDRIDEAPRQQDTWRGNAKPTAAEREQIAANPPFARAYDKDPGETLRLLRWCNDILSKARH